MKNKSDFFNTTVAGFFVFALIFYFTSLFMDKFGLLNLDIFINALVASCITSYALNRIDKK